MDEQKRAFAHVANCLGELRRVLSKATPVEEREAKVWPALLAAYDAWRDLPNTDYLRRNPLSPAGQLANLLNGTMRSYFSNLHLDAKTLETMKAKTLETMKKEGRLPPDYSPPGYIPPSGTKRGHSTFR